LGELHLVAIYDRALSLTEVDQNYFAGIESIPRIPPVITLEPSDNIAQEGEVASFSVSLNGSEPFRYQWQQWNGSAWVDIAGGTSAFYITPVITLADDGSLFRCQVSNSAGSVTSNAAMLSVQPTVYTLDVRTSGGGSISVVPNQETFNPGESVTLTVTADPGWEFSGWIGDASGMTNPLNVYMEDDKSITALFLNSDSTPLVDIWYGNYQRFGHLGDAQRWINILGKVVDPDGIASLTYSLNGGAPINLEIGPDNRRLADEGDFNVDIDRANLNDGPNQVYITATDTLNNTSIEIVVIEYLSGNIWPSPYSIDWGSVTQIQDAVQVVDGQWSIVAGGLRTAQIDYDRVVAVGDLSWTDYEVTIPIKVHAIDPSGYNPYSTSPGFGIVTRWQGHTDTPIVCPQPHCGWLPSGGGAWYDFQDGEGLKLVGLLDSSVTIEVGDSFFWKLRVETIPAVGPLYSLKVWRVGEPEPVTWNLTRQNDLSDVTNGSLIFIAHHVDLTLGDILVQPLTN
jgi:hypothetical protein